MSFRSPLVLALIVTGVNAIKPVLIDDTAYLTYARHIAVHPTDPYGFEIFWYTTPDPAFEVLCPPVLPYWLALGVGIFGEHPALLKLWCFPFVFLLAWALRELLRRFARGTESRLLPLLMLSPAVLPTVNLMLDIPAFALGLAAVVVFIRTSDRESWRLAVLAGLLAGLAMQTKYTALLIPPAILWYGITHRRIRLGVGAVAIATTVFVGWELLLVAKYDRSHFAYHAMGEPERLPGERFLTAFFRERFWSPSDQTRKPFRVRVEAFIREKSTLGPALTGHLGCLGIGVALVAAVAVGVPRRSLPIVAGIWTLGFLLVLFVPYQGLVIVPGKPPDGADVTATTHFWQAFGGLFLLGLAGCAWLLLRRGGTRPRLRLTAESLFLIGWVLLELAGYFVLTPFGAARRVIGLTIIGGLLAARVTSRVERIRPNRRLPRWVIAFGIAAGFAVTAIDTFDAFPEKACAERAAVVARDRPAWATVWYVGHWGFQFYCERAGMRPLIPGQSVLSPGDVLVLPIYPNDEGFFRPHSGTESLHPSSRIAQPMAEVIWEDVISGQTIPNFYCGVDPIVGRDHPRLRVVVYRIRQSWIVGEGR